MEFTPQIAISTGPWNHSFETLMKTKECVIAIPTVDLVQKVIGIGTVSGTELDKFEEFELTPLPAKGGAVGPFMRTGTVHSWWMVMPGPSSTGDRALYLFFADSLFATLLGGT
jgi:hypothetical protein